jgi:hypothetical protein
LVYRGSSFGNQEKNIPLSFNSLESTDGKTEATKKFYLKKDLCIGIVIGNYDMKELFRMFKCI